MDSPLLPVIAGFIAAALVLLAAAARYAVGALRRIEAKGNETSEAVRRHSNMFKRFLDENGHGDNFTKTQVLREDEIKWVK